MRMPICRDLAGKASVNGVKPVNKFDMFVRLPTNLTILSVIYIIVSCDTDKEVSGNALALLTGQ